MMYESLKCKDNIEGEKLLHKEKYILSRKSIWNYRAEVGMLIYLQGYT